ncbi:MAG: M23 family metallopeptidase [Clostridia bacterium]|nr:M23 family metallopeptidase [Clostridia bacterium]
MRYRQPLRNQVNIKYKSSFKAQLCICAVLLMALSVLKFTPADNFVKTKRAVTLILTQQTDLLAEFNKLKSIFTTEENMDALKPVSEFVNPAPGGAVTANFGAQDAQNSQFHYGVDIKMQQGSDVLAAASGEVTEIATSEEYGTYIIIKHSNEIFTLYAKLNEILPDVGEKVESGKPIARANVEDDTIHFEIRRADTYLNPADFIDFGE